MQAAAEAHDRVATGGRSRTSVRHRVPRAGPIRRSAPRPPFRDVAPRRGQTAAFALSNPRFEAERAARAWPVPPQIVDALASAERVVTIGHTPPDGDCVGAALGLARGLAHLGRQAHAIVDAELPAGLKELGRHGDLFRSAPPFTPDLVVLVDVAQAERIGEARDLLKNAPAVMVVDHHRVRPSRSQLGLAPNTPFTAWVDDRCDAASLQVAAMLETLGAAPDGWTDRWADVARPLAAGIATDTQWFRSPRANLRSLACFKGLLEGDLNALEELEAQVCPSLSAAAVALLSAQLDSAVVRSKTLTVAELAVTAQTRRAALAVAQRTEPRTTLEDISGHLMDRLDRAAATHRVAVLLQEEADGWVRVSVRSHCDDLAVRLAVELGGGGKRGVAGATVAGRLETVRTKIRRLITEPSGAFA